MWSDLHSFLHKQTKLKQDYHHCNKKLARNQAFSRTRRLPRPPHQRKQIVCCAHAEDESISLTGGDIRTSTPSFDTFKKTSEILPLSTVFFQPVELVTTCTLTMLGALEVVRAAYCAL